MAPTKLNPSLAQQFLKAVYGRFFSQAKGASFIEARGKREGEGMSFRRFYRTTEALLKDMVGWQPGLNYWVGVALRKDTKGGSKANLLALTAAFADVDVGSAGHKGATRYQDKSAAQAAIEQFPLRPSMLIDSGGGFQPYWLFAEAVGLTPETIKRLETINRGLALALGGDVEVRDVARILRLPGTFNMKIAEQPRAVKVVWCEPERVYELGAFAEYEAQGRHQRTAGGDARPTGAPAPREGRQGEPAAPPGGEYEAYASKAFADELAELARTPEGRRNARLNQAAFSLGQLIGAGLLDRGSVEAALTGTAAGIGLGEVEARATIHSGIEAGRKEPRELPEKVARRGIGGRQGKPPASQKGPPAGTPGPPQAGQVAGDEPEAKRIWWVGHCYLVERGRLCLEVIDREGRPDSRPLANFTAKITEEISRDDGGAKPSKEYRITGSLENGRPLPAATVAAKEFDSLKWVPREWGAAVSVAPGRSLGAHIGNAIQAHSKGFTRRTVFTHSGWRKIGGVWRYLHGGGAIGQGEQVEVDLGENLGNYRLPEPGGPEAAQASLRFLEIGPWEVTAPLIACTYLAPFADLLKIDFSLWLYGPTGGFKSTLAALALCHFGKFTRLTLPGSWFSTANSLEKLTFVLQDSLVVIDDFMPPGNSKEAHKMTQTAARLIYQAGNRSGRGRLGADLSAKQNHYPRCLLISTGEILLPGQRQSATARYLGVEHHPEKTPIDEARLTEAQKQAHLYPGAMADYLADLAPRLEDIQAEIRELWEGYRSAFQGTVHHRIPEIQAWLAVGFEYFLRFQTRRGSIPEGQVNEMLNRGWKVFEALGEKHSRVIEGERPTIKFLAILGELFYQGRAFVESANIPGSPPQAKDELGWEGTEPAKNAEFVGWADNNTLYLLPEMTFKAVAETIHRQGDFLPLGKNEMLAALAREGFIEPGRGENTQIKWIQRGSKRVICLPMNNLHPGEDREGESE